MSNQARTITVAVAQLPARPLEQAAEALRDVAGAAAEARQAGADLVVLPECCYPCYWLGSLERYRRGDLLSGPDLETWFADLAHQHEIAVVAGLVQEQEGKVYDAAVLFDRHGNVAGRHFKTFLWDAEHDWYQPGEAVRPIDTDLGRIGLVICAEGRSPEVFASHAAQSAGLLAMPTAWVNAATEPGGYYNPQPDYMIESRAREFGLTIVCANKFGEECKDARFCGMSMIVSGDGEILAKAPADQPALLVAEVRVQPQRYLLPEVAIREVLRPEPVLPPADAPPLRVAVLSTRLDNRDGDELRQTLGALPDQGVQMIVQPGPGRATAPPKLNETGLRQVEHATVGYVAADQARSFVTPRIRALHGAQVLCVTGRLDDLETLRMRAAENRVFVIGSPHDRPTIIAPSGAILARAAEHDAEPLIADLDLVQAAAKEVAPATDVWAERRCGAYCLGRRE